MLTYQDLFACGEDLRRRGEFIQGRINEHRNSAAYKVALDAEEYYHKHNVTMEKFVKWLYTVTGRQIEDVWSANYKLKTQIFRRLVIQQVSYVLSNGVFLYGDGHKDADGEKAKLGRSFDKKMRDVFTAAMVDGKAYGFWNRDHLEVFHFVETGKHPGFAPIYDADTGALRAGIRFWWQNINNSNILYATLYEPEGISEWRKGGDDYKEITEITHRTAYVTMTVRSQVMEEETAVNPDFFPIVEAVANDSGESEIIGLREKIDCFDFIESGMANEVDNSTGFYWVLKNSGGMEDADLASFIQRMKTLHVASMDGDDGATAEAHTMDISVDARIKTLEQLRADIYDDAQLLDVKKLSTSSKTATEIRAAYQDQDNKCGDFEFYILEFLYAILPMAGVTASPSLRWAKIVNQLEETNMILAAADFLDEDTIIKKLPFLTPEEADAVLASRANEGISVIRKPAADEEDDGGEE